MIGIDVVRLWGEERFIFNQQIILNETYKLDFVKILWTKVIQTRFK